MGKYMSQLKQLQQNQRTLSSMHSTRIAGLEQDGFLHQLQKQHESMTMDYYNRQIAEVLPYAIREAVQEEMARYLSSVDVSVSLDGEQLGKIAEVSANKIANGILGNLGK